MDFFWIIPCGIVALVFIGILYLAITRDAGERIDGEIITDKPSGRK
jgi:hypothetical protein